jgi:carbamoyl-phosphate synthase small subunit
MYNVLLIDCGVKRNIVNSLRARCNLFVAPYDITPQQIYKLEVDGVMVSNGPGDPKHPALAKTTLKTLREIVHHFPTMGICLGHQLLALAFGADTYKLKFGHRGANQPVKDLRAGRVYITSQNHGFAVDPHITTALEIEFTQMNVNDGTVEALQHRKLPLFSVQYHPEASPGPRDTRFLFDEFMKLVEANAGS